MVLEWLLVDCELNDDDTMCRRAGSGEFRKDGMFSKIPLNSRDPGALFPEELAATDFCCW